MKYWPSLHYMYRIPPYTIGKHKGPWTTQSNSTHKYIKGSTLCCQRLMTLQGNERSDSLSLQVRSWDTRTDTQVNGLIEWVCAVILAEPVILHWASIRQVHGVVEKHSLTGSCLGSDSQLATNMHSTPVISSTTSITMGAVSCAGTEASQNNQECTLLLSSLPSQQIMSLAQNLWHNDPVPIPCPSWVFSLQLAHDIITYSTNDIPDPPTLSFVCDLAKLDQLWDDKLPQWDNSSPLRIQGLSIAIIYWPQVYWYQGTRQWRGIKQQWFEWKVHSNHSFRLKPYNFFGSRLSLSIMHLALAVSGPSTHLMGLHSLSLIFCTW